MPPAWSNNVQPNSIHPDNSGFQFDLPPRDVGWSWATTRMGDVYDVPNLPLHPYHDRHHYIGWTHWLGKFQKDYRFAQISDSNAKAFLFPEVYDPWMFTEFVFKGLGRVDDKLDSQARDVGIVRPPLVAPWVLRTWLTNDDGPYLQTGFKHFNFQPATIYHPEESRSYELEYRWRSYAGEQREYWTSELNAMGWKEIVTDPLDDTRTIENRDFQRLQVQRRVVGWAQPTLNSGVRLYREPVWVASTRWGQSQNIPERQLSMTGPKSWFESEGYFTGKIVPRVIIRTGVPILDTIPQGTQAQVQYAGLQIGLWANTATIAQHPVVPQGVDGPASSNFTYTVTGGTAGAIMAPVPQVDARYTTVLGWNEIVFGNGDLVHHGCAFWKGVAGNASCEYYNTNSQFFQVSADDLLTFNTPDESISIVLIDFDSHATEEELQITFRTENHTDWVTLDVGGKTYSRLYEPGKSLTKRVRISQVSGSLPVKPLADIADGGFVDSPGGWLELKFERVRRNRPITHHALCAFHTDGDSETVKAAYRSAGGKCPFYTPQGRRTLATYEANANSGHEWSAIKRLAGAFNSDPRADAAASLGGMGMTGDLVAGAVQAGFIGELPEISGVAKLQRTTIDVTYEPEVLPPASKQKIYVDNLGNEYEPTYSDLNESGRFALDDLTGAGGDDVQNLQIKRGTGEHLIDEKSNAPMDGVDTPFFGMVNQTNYRVMNNIMHCYRPEECDPIITVPQHDRGFIRGRFSNIDFTDHEFHIEGYPAHDGSTKYCHYGNGQCPVNNPDRRAVEYDANYQLLREEILYPFRREGVDGFVSDGIREKFMISGLIIDLTEGEVDGTPPLDAVCVGAAPFASGEAPVVGHWHPVIDDIHGDPWRVFFYYDRPSWDAQHRKSHIAAHLLQFNDENELQFVPTSMMDATQQTEMDVAFGDHARVPWIVELFDDYQTPQGYAVQVSNSNAFAGGRNPEYKDQGARKEELQVSYGGERKTSTSSNAYGGKNSVFHNSVTDQATRGYWVDKDGDFIIHGIDSYPMPVFDPDDPNPEDFAPIKDRIKNRPPSFAGAPPIHGVPGISFGSTKTGVTSKSNYAIVGHTYANDSRALLEWFKQTAYYETDPETDETRAVTNWEHLLPSEELTPEQAAMGFVAGKVTTDPPDPDLDYIPRERYLFRCNVCGIAHTEEELNRFSEIEWLHPTVQPSGVPSSPEKWALCPRIDGGLLLREDVWDQIIPTTARGYADVWAPPGSTIRHDGYFWRHPTLVSRTHLDQIAHKLGQYNPDGGGYTFEGFPIDVENMGTLPKTSARHYEPGILRQLIMPWAQPGDSVASLRVTWRSPFGLDEATGSGQVDTAYVHTRDGTRVRVDPLEEPIFTLQTGDILKFEREQPGYPNRHIGLLIAAVEQAPDPILAEGVVVTDQLLNTMPVPPTEPYTHQDWLLYESQRRAWLLEVVEGSMIRWASSLAMPANLLADTLANNGLSPSLGQGFSPGDPPGSTNIGANSGPVPVDDRFVAAYTNQEDDGLKMITLSSIKRLRNRITPMLAYDSSVPAGTANEDYTRKSQEGHYYRFSFKDQRDLPFPMMGTIPPQVMAYNDTGLDYYVEWIEIENEIPRPKRQYYPVGTTWWRMNQKIGQIKRFNGINPLHLDDSLSRWDIPYTGDVITSTATHFLHGLIPMDKDIAKAYMVFTPNDGPSVAALGCMGVYDGYVGRRANPAYGDRDGIVDGTESYVGNDECFWQHFHPWTTDHETDIGSYEFGAVYGIRVTHGYGGADSMDHWLSGGQTDDGAYWTLNTGQQVVTPQFGDFKGFETHNTLNAGRGAEEDVVALPVYNTWFDDDKEDAYDPHVALMGMRFYHDQYGFGFEQPFYSDWTWGTDLVQLLTEHQTWKDAPFDAYNAAIEKYSAQARATVNTTGAIMTFDYIATPFRREVWAHEHQAIPGWINYASYDNSGRFSKRIEIEESFFDTSWANGPQVIVQTSDGEPNETPGGGTGFNSAGNVTRVLDVSREVNSLYKDRVSRFFRLDTGARFEDLYELSIQKTDTNFGTVARFHEDAPNDGEWIPRYDWNYRYFRPGYGMWLTDPWHMAVLTGDTILRPVGDADPITQTEINQQRRINEVSEWDDQGLATDHVDYLQYHPLALTLGGVYGIDGWETDTFDDLSGTGVQPVPVTLEDRYWRVVMDQPATHWFAVDLRQTPYETMRRPWRFKRPTVNAANAICHNNQGCLVAQNNWTVAQFYEEATSAQFGTNVVPNPASDICAFCGTPLLEEDGVVYAEGDGVTTVAYDPAHEPDVIVRGVEVNLDTTDGWRPTARHGFVVESFNSISQSWTVLFRVQFNEGTGQYSYSIWSHANQAWVTETDNALPSMFVGAEAGSQGRPRNSDDADGSHFIARAAQQLRFKVVQPASTVMVDGYATCLTDVNNRSVTVLAADLQEPPSQYLGRTITLKKSAEVGSETTGTIGAVEVDGSNVILQVSQDVLADHDLMQINWTSYSARATTFRVYGYPFYKNEVVITPPGYVTPLIFSPGNNEFPITFPPSQIVRMDASAGDDVGIPMSETSNPNGGDFYWDVADTIFAGTTYKRIVSGQFYYDYTRNSIRVPTEFKDEDGNTGSIWTLNDDLYDEDLLRLTTKPSSITMEYITGLGQPITLGCQATGPGPSYQLDRECVCFIAGSSAPSDDTVLTPGGEVSEPLASMGDSVRLNNLNGQRVPLYWHVYNHSPLVWNPEFGWLIGNELGPAAATSSDDDIMSVYTGGVGRRVSDITSGGAYLRGTVAGEVTLYGPPNTFVSGNVLVYAKRVTKRTVNTPSGPVTTYERTGGYASGAMVTRLEIDGSWDFGRKSISCGVPRLIIYLKERNLEENPDLYETQ